jgi:hypothetical protein
MVVNRQLTIRTSGRLAREHKAQVGLRQRRASVFCPDSGRNLAPGPARRHDDAVREHDLIDRVASSTGLTPGEAARVVEDVLAWYREPVEDFVRRRHAHYQLYGKRNPEIFALIAGELASRLVAAPSLSERQLRRIVYG